MTGTAASPASGHGPAAGWRECSGPDHLAGVARVKAELKSAFPEWRFLVSDQRRWWAMRGPLHRDRMHEVDAIDADTPEALYDRLSALGARLTDDSGRVT